jgi:integrative and conjugative element protein (TIGR02256 family)
MSVTWISNTLREALFSEVERAFPLETGGILMGYATENISVISTIIGPGPEAIHGPNSFAPDYDYHESEVARVYESSQRKWSYLGDWHSHPRQIHASLSKKDIQTLRRIASFKEARVNRPLMLIVTGEPSIWTINVWRWKRKRFLTGRPFPDDIFVSAS